MNDIEDKALAKKALKGDRQAFELLLSRHYDYMYKIAFKWSQNQSDAQDIVQNACVKLVKALKQYRGDSEFTTWLYQVVLNTAKDYFRSQAKHKDPQRISKPSEYKADDKVLAQQVLDKINDLPEQEKEALVLVSFKGVSHAEAAKICNCAESTISWRVHEARKKLASLMENGGRDGWEKNRRVAG